MKLPPADVLRKWPAPNYVNPESEGPALVIVNGVLLGLATAVLCLRLYVRLFVRKWFGWDDFFIICAWLCTLGVNIITDLGIAKYGWGRHIWDIPLSLATASLKLAYAAKILFLCAGFTTAASLLAFYYRLGRESSIKWFIWTLHITVVFNIVSWLPFMFAQIFICTPIYAYWTFPEPKGTTCVNEGPATMTGSVMKVFVDIAITTIPIPLILQLRMQKTQKYGVAALLGLGYLVTAAGAVRVYYTWKVFYGDGDQTWWQNPAFIAAAIENDVAIIVACLPTIRPLMPSTFAMPVNFLTRFRERSGGGSKNTTPKESNSDSSSRGTQLELQNRRKSSGFQKNGTFYVHSEHTNTSHDKRVRDDFYEEIPEKV